MRFNKSKFLLLALVLIISIGLLGCGGQTAAPQEDNQANQQVEEQNSGEQKTSAAADAANAYFANLPSDINKISQQDFVDKVKAGEDMFILDIRQADVYAEGHVKGAVNAPWGTAISDNLDKLPKDKTIMVYCYTGQTAGQTVALLNIAGFEAKSVNLGWNLGISKVEGVDAVVEKDANGYGEQNTLDIDSEIKAAITEYYEGLADAADTIFKNYKISEDNAKKLLDEEDDGIVFLSIRKADAYKEGHIEGAVNIPFGKGMEQEFDTLPKDKTIIVYCYTGQTAGQTVAVLKLLGYDAVSLNGGMGMEANKPSGWMNKGYSVVK